LTYVYPAAGEHAGGARNWVSSRRTPRRLWGCTMNATQSAAVLDLPLDDGAIGRAMAELNAKLAAWSAALTRAKSGSTRLSAKTRTRASTAARSSGNPGSVCGTQPGPAAKPHFGNVQPAPQEVVRAAAI